MFYYSNFKIKLNFISKRIKYLFNIKKKKLKIKKLSKKVIKTQKKKKKKKKLNLI